MPNFHRVARAAESAHLLTVPRRTFSLYPHSGEVPNVTRPRMPLLATTMLNVLIRARLTLTNRAYKQLIEAKMRLARYNVNW